MAQNVNILFISILNVGISMSSECLKLSEGRVSKGCFVLLLFGVVCVL
jgi:hypothetical protein